jgi:hypothetical protein
VVLTPRAFVRHLTQSGATLASSRIEEKSLDSGGPRGILKRSLSLPEPERSMRRRFIVLLALLVAVSCAKNEEEAALQADTTGTLPGEPTVVLADLNGTWRVDVREMGSDSIINSYTLFAGQDGIWKMNFDGRPDTMVVDIVGVAGDSVMTRFGPYSSMLRKDVQVVVEAVNRVSGDSIIGNAVAHYNVTTADSVLPLRTVGKRVN